MTNNKPQSPLVIKLIAAARADPQGPEAGLQKAIRKIERWLDQREAQGDYRRQMQVRIDRALADARMQLFGVDLIQTPFADSAEAATSRYGAQDAAKPASSARSWRASRIAGVVALAVIAALALGWRMGVLPSPGQQALFELDAGTGIAPGKDSTIKRTPGEKGFSVYSTAKVPGSGGVTGGAYLTLPPEIEDRASGRTVRVTVSAAAASNGPSREFAVAYSTAAVGNSGWRKFKPGPGLQTWSFDYAVPKRQEKPGPDFIGIWADTSGGGGGVRMEDIRLEVVAAED